MLALLEPAAEAMLVDLDLVTEPTPSTMPVDIVTALAQIDTLLPPVRRRPRRIEVSREMRDELMATARAASGWEPCGVTQMFGIPMAVDESLPPGGWRIVNADSRLVQDGHGRVRWT
jgi:hypothetical protein